MYNLILEQDGNKPEADAFNTEFKDLTKLSLQEFVDNATTTNTTSDQLEWYYKEFKLEITREDPTLLLYKKQDN